PYLPVLTGMAVKTQEVSSRFLEDYSRTLGDCFMNNCYRKVSELCQQYGIKWHSESGGPWDREKPLFLDSDQLAFWGRNDMPQGEFWHQRWQTLKDGTKVWLSNVRRTAMAAHIYGRPLVAAEAFTNMNPHWQEYPAVLKPEADDAFVDGVNQFVWHTFGASPVEFGKPGLVYFAGTHLNPNVTWWEDAGAFLTYLGRAQFLLRQGRFVSDACVYSSDRNYLTWGRDKKWSDKASLSLPKGYTYDLINTEVLVDRLSVENGSLVLPDGMRYRTLVLDLEENVMPPEALAKIVALARGGATVVLGQRRPGRELGLKGYPARDAEVQRLAGELWGTSNAQGARPFGKGKVIRDTRLEEALKLQAIVPDFAGPFEYIHRHSRDADIYFLAGTGRADCTFRIDGKEPELWDAVTGRIRDAIEWRATGDGRTVVPLSLPGNGSIFVVFRKPASNRHLIAISHPDGVEIEGRTPEGARLRLWRPGPCALESADKSQVNVAASNLPEPLTLTGAWEVRFSPGWGAPASTVFEQLTPWNEDSRTAIKHFSGTATYRKAFELDEARAKRPLRLQLGEVKDIAQVRVNGKSLGVVWTDPWTVDLTGVIRPGKNQLEVDVTNTWVNRLIGDAALPEQERLTRTMVRRSPSYQGRYPYLRGYLATDSLLRSGLLGPVRLEFGEERDVRF
ncbi:MAG: hypothetical protein HY238_12170, partial [Acidobacteria bacterium]|nr:hypothetical protein [Acidobacteriota bacterium]